MKTSSKHKHMYKSHYSAVTHSNSAVTHSNSIMTGIQMQHCTIRCLLWENNPGYKTVPACEMEEVSLGAYCAIPVGFSEFLVGPTREVVLFQLEMFCPCFD